MTLLLPLLDELLRPRRLRVWLAASRMLSMGSESPRCARSLVLGAQVAELLGQDTSGPDALAGVDPAVEATLEGLLAQFAFPLDAFQVQALRHLLAGRSVVVCAPTGAGKTAVAEAAAIDCLARGQRVVYTTPLKALSNQKLQEMKARFGVDRVGLQTGDASSTLTPRWW